MKPPGGSRSSDGMTPSASLRSTASSSELAILLSEGANGSVVCLLWYFFFSRAFFFRWEGSELIIIRRWDTNTGGDLWVCTTFASGAVRSVLFLQDQDRDRNERATLIKSWRSGRE